MDNGLKTFGAIATGLYVAAVGYYVFVSWVDFQGLAPNAVGDFLAGSFSPLAFLWLVLGFFQQGKELRLTNNALQLQAEELRNSVEQQRDLVAVNREQVDAEREAAKAERERRIVAIQPIFGFRELICQQDGGGGYTFYGEVQNVGGGITELNIDIDSEYFTLVQSHYPALNNGQSFKLYLRLKDMANFFGFAGRFHYRDAEGGYSTQAFGFAPIPETPERSATLRRVSTN